MDAITGAAEMNTTKHKPEIVRAWHFSNGFLRYGDEHIPVEAGYLYTEDRPIKLCKMGLHGSTNILDALDYATALFLSETEHSVNIIYGCDKLVSSHREVIRTADVTEQVVQFAEWCVGRAAALAAAWDAARAAAWDAARAAAWDAGDAGDAAWAARDAAWAAEREGQEQKLLELIETAKWSYGYE